jgi:sterol desaturase/sphingolipid hydroxylase (fatty acid hydroxylase superfamily)
MREAARFIFHRPILLFLCFLAARAVVCAAVERIWPAQAVSYKRVLWRDLVAMGIFLAAIGPAAQYLNQWAAIRPVIPPAVNALPLALRFFLYLILADFGHYWVHRAMHTPHLWRIHKWHHYPTYMYWLAGTRGSLAQQTLVNIPYIAAAGLIDTSPWWMVLVIAVKNILQNDWMHLNVTWGSTWLEWFVITPRYHHIHHSDNPDHYRANLAPLFPIWDRLFGTYVDPQSVARPLSFGIGERVPAARLAIGV